MRFEKLKNENALNKAGNHNSRTRKMTNIDEEKTEKNISFGKFTGDDLGVKMIDFYKQNNITIRKNGVLGLEFVLTASPEFFRKDVKNHGEFDKEKTKNFAKAAKKWVENEFGKDNIACGNLHLDEATPHLHIIVMPLLEGKKKKRLSAKNWIDGREKLSKLQDSFFNAVKHLGLERGTKNSIAKHTDLKEYYQNVNKPIPKIDINLKEKPALQTFKTWKTEQETELKNNLFSQLKPVFDIARNAKSIQKQSKKLKETGAKFKEKTRKFDAERLREIPLEEVLEVWEFEQNAKQNWTNEAYNIRVTKQKWYNFYDSTGGYGAIDLVKKIEDCSFQQACKLLSNRFGEQKIEDSFIASEQQKIKETVRENFKKKMKKTPEFIEPSRNGDNEKIKKYLCEQRKIDESLIQECIDEGIIYANNRCGNTNVVFKNKSKNIAEIRGINSKYKGLYQHSIKKNLGFEIGFKKSSKIVLVESAIDALSYYELHKKDKKMAHIISLAGENKNYDYVNSLIASNNEACEVILAFDNDDAGKAMAKTWEANLTALRVHRDVPDGKDWNDDLIKLKAAIAAGTAEKDHYTYSTAHIYKNESRPSFLKAEDYIEIDEDGDKPLTIYDMGFEPNY
jgi:5S rRNA maturation endonuclease (ribonuclease M5)